MASSMPRPRTSVTSPYRSSSERETLNQPGRGVPGALEEPGGEHFTDGSQGSSSGERVAAEGAAVVALHEVGRDLVAGKDCADRHAAGKPLRQGHDVRPHAVVFEGEERSRAADAGLYLVKDQEEAAFITPGAEPGKVARRGAC
jgi:hypothetical protein